MRLVLVTLLAACAGAPIAPVVATPPKPIVAKPEPAKPVVDEERPPPKRLLAIDWDRVPHATDAEALAIWQQIAPTADDWEQKLLEIPTDKPVAAALARALLREGNFACPAAPHPCSVAIELAPLAADATLASPCLRRLLALWAIEQLEPRDVMNLTDALDAIVAIPVDTTLVAAALHAYPEAEQDRLLNALAIAWKAGHADEVAGEIGRLDEAHQIVAATKHHIDPAVEVLSPVAHKPVFLAAVVDEQLSSKQRSAAIVDLATSVDEGTKLPADVAKALATATSSRDCRVAATAARMLVHHGEPRFLPKRTAAMTTVPQLMRGLCLVAGWQELADNAEPSLLEGYLAKDGFEEVRVTNDPLGPPQEETARVERSGAVLPELRQLLQAMAHCTGTSCSSDDLEFQFTWKPVGGALVLRKLAVVERPSCSS